MIRIAQRILRWGFMSTEAVFNRAFGDRANPFYHLGAIAFFLFWLICISGLYLYIFFDTSASGAHASVEALTHGQWYLGGIMRSLHRYGSDALVLVMALHLARYFAFDRLHGYRWFAWVTGVGLIWFVILCGINGYMLPWDRLAQFVTVASFEGLDWLPGVGGGLARTFIYADGVDDRFFSLLAFIHIGGPLLTLLLMWVHIQRVPRASTTPPRAIAIGVLAMLLALSVVLPALSQGGPADLGTAVAVVGLDWYYLGALPLLYVLPLWQVWMLAAVLTLLLAALPWLPPWRRGQPAEVGLEFHPGRHRISARAGETLLEAGLRAGLSLPYECRSGGCGVCLCTVLQGPVAHGDHQPAVLSAAMRAHGKALMCCASPLADVVVEVDVHSLEPRSASAVRSLDARVAGLNLLSDDVMQVLLTVSSSEPLDFVAGQYVNVVLEDGQRRAFSFANAPHHPLPLELHVRLVPGGLFTPRVFASMKIGDTLRIEGPFGRFSLSESQRPIILIATTVGFAPIKSILEDAFHRGLQRPMQLYWGARHRRDLYLLELAERWAREHANFRFEAVLSGEPDTAWSGRRGRASDAILADHPDLSGFEVYACGSVRMVEDVVPAFLARGLSEDACFSDAFVAGFTAARADGASEESPCA
jgi:CDP-4-dehydro-6-deoxyglucose reductase, E3